MIVFILTSYLPLAVGVLVGASTGGVYAWHVVRKHKKTSTQKDMRVKEAHHRVKNSLQSVTSLLEMQQRQATDDATRSTFKEAAARLQAVARLHERLYTSADSGSVDMEMYLTGLCADLQATAPDYALKLRAESLKICPDTAIQAGLVCVEMVTNALKHAHPAPDQQHLDIAFGVHDDQQLKLTVRDYGQGLPYGFNLNTPQKSLGVKIITDLAAQMKGRVNIKSLSPGTQWELFWPLTHP